MTRPHRGHITGRVRGYFWRLRSALVRSWGPRLVFLLGFALLFAFPIIGWWAILLGLAAMYGAAGKRTDEQ